MYVGVYIHTMSVCRSLLAIVNVVDDCPSARAMALAASGRIKHRAKVSGMCHIHDIVCVFVGIYLRVC